MNKLSTEKRAQIIHCIVEGNSLRATARLTATAINTVVNLMIDAGKACSIYQDKVMRNLKCKRLQCDEIWGFVGCKEKNVPEEQKNQGRGSVWTWTALDAETKLVPCWFIDADGNLTFDGVWFYTWDAENRLIEMTMTNIAGIAPSNCLQLNFGYDYMNRRISKVVLTNSGGTNFVAQ